MVSFLYKKLKKETPLLRAIIVLLFSTALMANEIVAVNKNGATIHPTSYAIGTSGIVIHHYDKEHASIVARAIVVDKDKIRFEVFDALAQDALPRPKTLPQKGDEVILGYLYDRATIIAPNLATYQAVASKIDEELLHPDLFATELSKAKHPVPSREDFKNFCNKYALAKIYIAFKDSSAIVDCYSFQQIGSLQVKSLGKNIKLPFYSRLKEIESSIFDFFSKKEIQNYDAYYKSLMEQK